MPPRSLVLALAAALSSSCAGKVPAGAADASTIDAGRIMNPADAAIASPDGASGSSDGATASPDGAPASPDGSSADGTTAQPDAATAQADASTGPTQLPGDPALCPAGYRDQLAAGQHAGFASGGQQRSFLLALPPASFTGPRPLVFAFHGTGATGDYAFTYYDMQPWVDKGFIVVAPDGNENGTLWPTWDALELPGSPPRANADLAFFDDLVQCVAGHHAVDARRVYVLGQSAGGAMSNFILGKRSSLLAGGIPASGAFDLTQTSAVRPISPMIVIVTWGGANDVYSGLGIDNISYAEQSALASQYWEGQPGSHQIACEGDGLGHSWLHDINLWMRDVLLAHPKGAAVVPGETLPPLPGGAAVSCREAAAVYTSPITVSCPASARAGCQQYCQMVGDCLVENGTLGPTMTQQTTDLGFTQTGNVCSGCVTRCESDAQGSAPDGPVLSCLATAAPAAACGPGFAGAAIFATVGGCCQGAAGSKVCARFCTTFAQNPLFAMLLTGCP